ncbi:MAG: ferritin-like domain-containing protein [Vicinamibacterales bacterium]
MAQSETLRDKMLDELKDLYHAEKQLIKALPKLAKAATHGDLRSAFETHLEETQGHVSRLEEAFELLDEKVKAKPCAGMAGIIEEGADTIKESDKGPVLDACLVASAQRAEHYEMAAYGTVIAWAKVLGQDDLASLLEQTLDEEKATDEKLSALAESDVNQQAAGGEESEASEEEDEPELVGIGASRATRRQPAAIGRDAGSSRQGAKTQKIPGRGRR